MVNRFLPVAQTASITKFSSLSRNQVAEFFTLISRKKVYAATICKLCVYLDFDPSLPIPIAQVQRLFLVACLKELINGGSSSYKQIIIGCRLGLTDPNEKLLEAWQLIQEFGGISKSDFDKRLTEFYAKNQLDKTKV